MTRQEVAAGKPVHRFYPLLAAWLVVCLLGVVACDSPARDNPDGNRPPPLLLISIDGFRPDYLDRAETPSLDRLIDEGLEAEALVHVFPTKTFPTHYSMATGLYTENTGVVANSMWDPDRGSRFSLRDRDSVSDGYWYDGEPIWVTAENQGLRAATYFWPGSEARIDGVRPTWWKPYNPGASHAQRIDRALEWLDMPAEAPGPEERILAALSVLPGIDHELTRQRPSLITLYFSRIDSLGHRHGPDAEEIDTAIESMDNDLARLLDGLAARELLGEMHILIVSDHGMTGIHPDRTILLDDHLDLGKVQVSDWGPAAQIWADELSADEIVAALDGAHPRMRVWKREDTPARYRFRDHTRIADVLAEADSGWMISNTPHMAADRRYPLRGMHGWDPAHEEMGGIFIAHGPAFEAGSRMPRVESVHLYELMARLLDLEPAPNDGSIHAFAGHADLPGLDADRRPTPPPIVHGDRDRPGREVHGIAGALENFDELEGRPIALQGRITRVCQNRGCWAVLAEGEQTIRLYARDHSFSLPADATGHARAFGELQQVEITPDHARHLVEDDGDDETVLEVEYEIRLIADSVVRVVKP